MNSISLIVIDLFKLCVSCSVSNGNLCCSRNGSSELSNVRM